MSKLLLKISYQRINVYFVWLDYVNIGKNKKCVNMKVIKKKFPALIFICEKLKKQPDLKWTGTNGPVLCMN
jgi:hypothetical protein